MTNSKKNKTIAESNFSSSNLEEILKCRTEEDDKEWIADYSQFLSENGIEPTEENIRRALELAFDPSMAIEWDFGKKK